MKKIDYPTAFHKWVWKKTDGNPAKIASLLVSEVVNNQNQQAFELLEMTGDVEYTKETFIKASDLLINTFSPESKHFYIPES